VSLSGFVEDRNWELIAPSGGAGLAHSVEKPGGKALAVLALDREPRVQHVRRVSALTAGDWDTATA